MKGNPRSAPSPLPKPPYHYQNHTIPTKTTPFAGFHHPYRVQHILEADPVSSGLLQNICPLLLLFQRLLPQHLLLNIFFFDIFFFSNIIFFDIIFVFFFFPISSLWSPLVILWTPWAYSSARLWCSTSISSFLLLLKYILLLLFRWVHPSLYEGVRPSVRMDGP